VGCRALAGVCAVLAGWFTWVFLVMARALHAYQLLIGLPLHR